MDEKKIQKLLKKLPDAKEISPEAFFDNLVESFGDIGLYSDLITRSIESKAWDHTRSGYEEWEAFLRRYKRLLTRVCSELELHTKIHQKIIADLYTDETEEVG